MKTKVSGGNIYDDRRLLPNFDFNNSDDIISGLDWYHSWYVRNSPELMPCNNSINKYIDSDILLCVLLTDAAKKNNNNGDYPGVQYSLEIP